MKRVSRRRFLETAAALGSGLVVPFVFSPRAALAADAPPPGPRAPRPVSPNAFLRIDKEGLCTVVVKHTEIGQGSTTALPMLVAEELECDWNKVRWELAPAGDDYVNLDWGIQGTGGSSGVSNSWVQLRTVGAQARLMLMQAAANQWKVKLSDVRADKGFVMGPGGRKLAYGALAEAAGKLPVPEKVDLKPAKDFRVIGKPLRRLDAADKASGKTVFGFDMKLKNLHTAVVAHPPVFGAKPAAIRAEKVKSVGGVTDVVEISNGVAVVARNFWAAKLGRDALEIEWELAPRSQVSTEALAARFRELARTPGKAAKKPADAEAFKGAAKTVVAEYEVPYLSHATMEPMNCTVELREGGAEIWTGSQAQTSDRQAAAKALGLEPSSVKLNTLPAGGGFGRRGNPDPDIVVEACEVARKAKVPVKLVWTREDDLRGGYYRPMAAHRVEAALDAAGKLVAWKHVVVASPIVAGVPPEALAKMTFDPAAVEGIADSPYDLPNLDVSTHSVETPVPVLWWRSVGYSHTVFAVESMVDELAAAVGRDPLDLRRELLSKNPRALRVLETAAARAGWGTSPGPGRGRGVAIARLRGTVCAHVAEVSLEGGKPRVHRVVSAVDCGLAVNPLTVESQIQGAVAHGLSVALREKITLRDGRVEQSNFTDYPVLRFTEMPKVEVHVVAGGEAPTGVGEPGLPAVAPAVANALFALTGKRARTLPLGGAAWA